LRPQFNPAFAAVGRAEVQFVRDEIERDIEDAVTVRDRPGRQAKRRDVERHMPRVIGPRRLLEPDLPNDLRPQLQIGARLFPFVVRKGWPYRFVRHFPIP